MASLHCFSLKKWLQQRSRQQRKSSFVQSSKRAPAHRRTITFECLEGRELLSVATTDVVRYRLALTDASNQPLPVGSDGIAQIAAGQTVRLHGYTQDVRFSDLATANPTGSTTEGAPQGVFAAYMDLLYANANASGVAVNNLITVRYGETQQLQFTPFDPVPPAIYSAPISGQFTLTFDGQTTAPITYDAHTNLLAPAIQQALEGLSNVGHGNVLVSVPPSTDRTFRIRFMNGLGERNVPMISINRTSLQNCQNATIIERFPADLTDTGTFWSSFTAVSPFIHGLKAASKGLETGQPANGLSIGPVGDFFEGYSYEAKSLDPTGEFEFFQVDFKAQQVGQVAFSGNTPNDDGTDTLVFPADPSTPNFVVNPTLIGFVQDISHPLLLKIMPADVYVNAAWSGVAAGTDPDGAGPATSMGLDAFATFTDGLNGVGRPGTVHVALPGTSNNDTLTFESLVNADPAYHTLNFSGTSHTVPASVKVELNVNADAGSDTATLTDWTGSLAATLRPTSGTSTITGLGYTINLQSAETITVVAHHGGQASLYDSAGADQFQAGPQWAFLRGSGFLNQVTGLDAVYAYGTVGDGAADTVYLYDSAGTDQFQSGPQWAFLRGSGFLNQATGFDTVYAEATLGDGAADTAYLYDSAGTDQFQAGPQWSFLRGSGFFNQASGFDSVYAEATAGDTAFLYGAAGADQFQAGPQWSFLRGTGFFNQASGFTSVYAYGTAADTAYLYGAAGEDQFQAGPQWSFRRDNNFLNVAMSFGSVYAYGAAGDTAYLYDSPGADQFQAGPQWSYLRGSGFLNVATSFDSVYAYATPGDAAADTAYLYGSSGADQFQSGPQWSFLRGSGFYNNASSFDAVYAYGTTGDTALLYGAVGADEFQAGAQWAFRRGSGFYNNASGFAAVYAYGATGDTASFYGSSGADELRAGPQWSYLQGSGFYDNASGFDALYAYGGAGDVAYLTGSAGVDEFQAGPRWSFLRGSGFYDNASGFDAVYAYGAAGDTAYLNGSAGADEFQAGPRWSFLRGSNFYNNASGFDSVFAYAPAGDGAVDTAYLYDSTGADEFQTGSQWLFMRGSGYYNNASGFDVVRVSASKNDGDVAYLYDSTGSDTLHGQADTYDFARSVDRVYGQGFKRVVADTSKGGTDTLDLLALDYVFQQTGTWH